MKRVSSLKCLGISDLDLPVASATSIAQLQKLLHAATMKPNAETVQALERTSQ
jgi:hypothetical protein